MSTHGENDSSDDDDVFYTLGSDVSDSDGDQSSSADGSDASCHSNDSVCPPNDMKQHETLG